MPIYQVVTCGCIVEEQKGEIVIMMNNKMKRIVAGVIAGTLAIIMIVTMIVPYIL